MQHVNFVVNSIFKIITSVLFSFFFFCHLMKANKCDTDTCNNFRQGLLYSCTSCAQLQQNQGQSALHHHPHSEPYQQSHAPFPISAVTQPRGSDYDYHTICRAVVRICAPHLLAIGILTRTEKCCFMTYATADGFYLIAFAAAYPIPVEACRGRDIAVVKCCIKCAILACSI